MLRNSKRLVSVGAVTLLMFSLFLTACAAQPAAPPTAAPAPAKAVAPAAAPAATTAPASAPTTAAPAAAAPKAAPKWAIATTFRNMVNEYWTEWNAGGKEAADALGVAYTAISGDDSEQKQLGAVEDAVAKGANAVVVMPVSMSILPAIADYLEKKQVLFVSAWDKPKDLDPEKYKYWVAHLTQDSEVQGYEAAKQLIKAIGGKGNIVAIDGIPGTGSAEDRHTGLLKALKENPDVKLLGSQTGQYNRFKTTPVIEDFITSQGDKINGVWAANDDMAMGVIEALKTAKLTNVKVVGIDTIKEAVDAINAGSMYSTLGGDAKGMHGTALTLAYDALNGVRPPAGQKMQFWTPPIVTPDNVKKITDEWFVNYKVHPWADISKTFKK